MANIIIGIHGLSNKPAAEDHKNGWIESIKEGLKNIGATDEELNSFTFHDIYWANLLYKYPLHGDKNYSSDALFDSEPYLKAEQGTLTEYKDSSLDIVRARSQNIGDILLDSISKRTPIAEKIVEKFARDLDFYYDKEKRILPPNSTQPEVVKTVLQNVLLNKLNSIHKEDKIMLIAHSMGSVIAFDALNSNSLTRKIEHFVTIGSPLGLPHVKLNATNDLNPMKKPSTPENVTKTWFNFSDKRDPIAFDTHLNGEYTKNSSNVSVQDDLVNNSYVGLDKKFNHHKIFGYLRAPELSIHILNFIKNGI